MSNNKLISEKRNYKVTTVAEAKEIVTNYLNRLDLTEEILFGLPEINDRYHEWRVPLLNKHDYPIGFIIINAKTEKIKKDKSTNKNLLKSRISMNPDENKKNKRKGPYPISPLKNTIQKGDSEKILNDMPDNSVDLIFTSPPYYNARRQYKEYTTYEEYLNKIRKIIRKAARTLVDGRFFVMNISHILIPRTKRSESSTRLAVPFDIHRLFIEEGFEFIDDIIWKKPEGAGWASGRGRRFSADRNALQYKSVPVTEYVLVYRKKSNRLIGWFYKNHPDQEIVEKSKINGEYETTNIWEITPAHDKRHPAIFPKELAKKVIKYYSFINDVVLDPFAGIGTAGKAALNLNRRFVMLEKKEKYIDAMIDDFEEKYPPEKTKNIKIINHDRKIHSHYQMNIEDCSKQKSPHGQ